MWKLAVAASLVGSVAFADRKPAVSVGTVQVVVGTFDVAPATKVVKAAQGKVLECYADHLGGGGGTATAQLKLAVDGKVTSVTVSGIASSETAPVHNCIADALGKLKFAAPKDGAVVDLSIPFVFTGGRSYVSIREDDPYLGGVIGNGTYGTIGMGGGKGSFGVGGSRTSGPRVSLGQSTTSGDLDKAIIRRYIHRNLQKIRYCYEKELLATPTLEGKVTAQFTIAPSGNVSTATAGGMNNVGVETCVAAVIKRIEFPKPKGGAVVVSYPFIFQTPPPAPKKK